MPQLPLPLTLPELFSKENFYVSNCNSEAYSTILIQKNWQGHALYLYGAKSSGKSHLAHIWQQQSNACQVTVDNIKPENINGNCLVEDIEQSKNQEALLHLFNHCKEIGAKLLLTSSYLPTRLPFTLPDLTSRLRACQLVTINLPDDALITNVMYKLFSDRQLMIDSDVIAYLAPRMERTLEGVKELVEKLDKFALAEQKNITIPFVKRILGY